MPMDLSTATWAQVVEIENDGLNTQGEEYVVYNKNYYGILECR